MVIKKKTATKKTTKKAVKKTKAVKTTYGIPKNSPSLATVVRYAKKYAEVKGKEALEERLRGFGINAVRHLPPSYRKDFVKDLRAEMATKPKAVKPEDIITDTMLAQFIHESSITKGPKAVETAALRYGVTDLSQLTQSQRKDFKATVEALKNNPVRPATTQYEIYTELYPEVATGEALTGLAATLGIPRLYGQTDADLRALVLRSIRSPIRDDHSPQHYNCRSVATPTLPVEVPFEKLKDEDKLRHLFGKVVSVPNQNGVRGKVVAIYLKNSYSKARESDLCVSIHGVNTYLKLRDVKEYKTRTLYCYRDQIDVKHFFEERLTTRAAMLNRMTRISEFDVTTEG